MEPLSANDPRMIGEFRLHARLGAGGMGQVYLGFSPAGRAVAIKVVHTQFARDQEFLQRFSREVAAARAVSGMYTAPVVGSGLDDNPPWLATAYVPGPPLATVVARHGPLPETAIWRLAAGLAEALRAVHAAGLVHRDLKPANVLLADDGPHVIDFGISRAFQGTQLTSAGMVIGTPGYMSPEQAQSDVAGPSSDIFSLGCVLYYAAAGTPPFGDGTAASILFRVVSTEPDLSPVTSRLRQVIEACLKKDPAQRPGPAELIAMISALGPATALTLGSFWPQDVARVISAEQARQTPAGLTPPGPVSAAFGAAAAVSGPGPAAAYQASPAPAERTPTALATPPPTPAANHTGHAPMMSDGYIAMAAQARITPNPVAPGPSVPLSPPSQPGGPPWGAQPPVGQAPFGQATFGQAGFGSGTATPPGAGAPSGLYPGQAFPPSGPQRGGATPWPAAGPPGGADALAQYRPGTRNPGASEIPRPVHTAIRLMYAGFVVTALDVVLSLVALGRYTHAANQAKNAAAADAAVGATVRAARETAVMNAQNQFAGAMTIGLAADVLGLACWAWLAIACRRGRGWTRVAGPVLLGLYTLCMLAVEFKSSGDPGPRFATFLVWVIGVATVIPLWGQQARQFFATWRKR